MFGQRGMVRLLAAGCAAALLAFAGCGGGGERQDADEPEGTFEVDATASFPVSQRLADTEDFVVRVRNTGDQTVPNVAVTIRSGDEEGSPLAFAETSEQPDLADPSRPVWIVNEGPVGGVTAYYNTWALGPLRPGETKTFTWNVSAVVSGIHTVTWQVAGGLDGKANAVLANGEVPEGEFTVAISRRPAQTRVDAAGRVVEIPEPDADETTTTPATEPAT